MTLLTKSRAKVRPEDFADAATATKKLNTQVLTPIYSRLESLERKLFVDLTLTTKTPVSATWPYPCPAPPWQVRGIFLANLWNVTDNSFEPTAAIVPFRYDPTGTKLFIQGINLTAGKQYQLTLKLEGDDAQL